jgi:hypothetical protein
VDHARPAGRRRPERAGHAGIAAGTIAVDALDSDEHATQVRATYDLTALTTAGESWLEAFEADYDAEIQGWGTAIAAALERQAQES